MNYENNISNCEAETEFSNYIKNLKIEESQKCVILSSFDKICKIKHNCGYEKGVDDTFEEARDARDCGHEDGFDIEAMYESETINQKEKIKYYFDKLDTISLEHFFDEFKIYVKSRNINAN